MREEPGAPMILTVVEDLIFLSKIEETAKALSVAIGPSGIADAVARLRAGTARGLLIDLNHRSGRAVELIEQLKSDPATANITVVGFLSHVQADLADSARAAGCDMVLARSAFVKQLPQLLVKLDGATSAPAATTS
ncbi:MAG: hypothetical protein HY508_12790 [Acidobacteria bacterium]|nr:hypothetical protein [Acidobacteriota bacterium]